MGNIAGPVYLPQRTITGGTYILDASGPDFTVFHNCSQGGTYLMPAPTGGRVVVFADKTGNCQAGASGGGSGTIALVPNGKELIMGGTGVVLTTSFGQWMFQSDGVNGATGNWVQIV